MVGSFNMLVAPNAGGFFVGDYEALGVNGTALVAVLRPDELRRPPARPTAPTSTAPARYPAHPRRPIKKSGAAGPRALPSSEGPHLYPRAAYRRYRR